MLGYVGRVSADDLLDSERYQGTLHTGKVGQKRYEPLLHGKPGFQHVETNAHGRVLRVLDRQPEPGQDLRLYLDLDLQRVAVDALGQQRGAVVALDPLTGGVIPATTKFVSGDQLRRLCRVAGIPASQSCGQGQYPPGSTIKPMLALARWPGAISRRKRRFLIQGGINCPVMIAAMYWTLRVRGSGHAEKSDLRMAIAESCDTYYYDLTNRMGIDAMASRSPPLDLVKRPGLIRRENNEACPAPNGSEVRWRGMVPR